MNTRDLNKHLGRMANRVKLMVGRGIVKLINDGGGLQVIQMEAMKDEILTNIERFQEYGFSSHPPSGSECVFLALGGKRDNAVIVAVDNQEYRPTELEEGEVIAYGPMDGETHQQRIYFDEDGGITIKAKTVTLQGDGAGSINLVY